MTEVAPNRGKRGAKFRDYVKGANEQANPKLLRFALKLATGTGKTTVMAMMIAWQTVNPARRPQSKRFTTGFLVVAPGITIKDRLRVLQPNDPDAYYASRELVPPDMLEAVDKAKIVITNYHAFKLRERLEISKGGRAMAEGWREEKMQPLETEGQMLQRVMPELMGMKNILVLKDEAHHCYREKQGCAGDPDLQGQEKKRARRKKEERAEGRGGTMASILRRPGGGGAAVGNCTTVAASTSRPTTTRPCAAGPVSWESTPRCWKAGAVSSTNCCPHSLSPT